MTKIILAIFASSLFFLSAPQPVLASAYTTIKNSVDIAAKKGYGGAPPITNIPTSLGQFVGAILSLLGIVFLCLMIYGGFLWMTAAGDEQKVKKSIDIITAAIIGLIIVTSAYAITAFVGGAVVKP